MMNKNEWKKVKLEDVCDILDNKRIPITASKRKKGVYPYYGANGIQDYVDDYIFDDELILLAEDGGNFGSKTKPIAYRVSGKCWVNNHAHVLKAKENFMISDFLCYSLMFYDVTKIINGATRLKLTQSAMRNMLVPLPELREQEKIVKKLQYIEEILKKKKEQIKYLDNLVKFQFLKMFGDPILNEKNWKNAVWKNILIIKNGKNQKQVENIQGIYPIYGSGGIIGYADEYLCEKNTVIIGRKGNINKPILVKTKFWNVDTAFGLEPIKKVLNSYFLYYFCIFYNFEKHNKAVTIPSLTKNDLLEIKMPLPPIELQNKFANFVKQVDKSKVTFSNSLILEEVA